MQLTDNQKKIGIVVGGILVIGTIIFLVTKKPKQDSSGSMSDPTGNNDSGGSGGAIYAFNASSVAQGLYDAMADLGTDEEAIFNLLAPVSQAQFAQVIQKFGSRVYNSWTGGTSLGSPQPLKVWLKSELSSSDYEILRKKFPSYL